jgi:glyoxylase-like metal-dependent hydrolase (beta-lactamase superfamily II)
MSVTHQAPAEFVSRRRLGEVVAAAIDVGTMHFRPADNPALLVDGPWSWDRVADPDGRVVLGVNVVVLQLPAGTIVVDPCTFKPDELTAADATIVPGRHMDEGLAELGVDPAEVTHVLVTHAHEDHFSGLLSERGGLRFPNALHILPEADWRTIVIPGHPFAAGAADLRQTLALTGLPGGALLVSGEYEVCPGVTLVPTPGETEGHQIVRVQTSEGRFYVLGDLVHWPPELEEPLISAPTSPPSEVRLRVVRDSQTEPSILIFTHARFPGWGQLLPERTDTWRWESL